MHGVWHTPGPRYQPLAPAWLNRPAYSIFNMTSSTKADWLIPTGLITLSFIPVAVGAFRVLQLGGGAEVTPDNARFFAAPLPVVLHLVSSVI